MRIASYRACSCTLAALALLIGTAHGATLLLLDSEPGDYIGRGKLQMLSSADGAFTGSASPSAVLIDLQGAGFWFAHFAAPAATPLAPGEYENATRYGLNLPEESGLDVSGDGRGCNRLTGRFLVQELIVAPDGSLQRFSADFEQHCEDAPAALYGAVRFNSDVTVTRPCRDEDRDGKWDATDA